MKQFRQSIWEAVCVSSYVVALGIATVQLIGKAAYEIILEEWNGKKRATDVEPFPKKATVREREESRLRREQKLIQKFKNKN